LVIPYFKVKFSPNIYFIKKGSQQVVARNKPYTPTK
jgi:hypothetical protein